MNEKVFDDYFNNGHLNDEALALSADALMFNEQRLLPVSVQSHQEECVVCKTEVISIYQILQEEGKIRATDTDPFIAQHKFHFNFKYAAVIMAILGISGLVYYFISFKKSSGNQVIVHTDSLKKRFICDKPLLSAKKDSTNHTGLHHNHLAMNMKESPLFENLVSSYYRSNDIEILAPLVKQKYTVSQPIVFKFKGNLSNPVSIIIYRNNEKKIFAKDQITDIEFKLDTTLPPGLYYWKLLRDHELLYAGKFFVH